MPLQSGLTLNPIQLERFVEKAENSEGFFNVWFDQVLGLVEKVNLSIGFFGKICLSLTRFLQLPTLWKRDYIYGPIEKEKAQSVLENKNAGTFLIRFSREQGDMLVLSFVNDGL